MTPPKEIDGIPIVYRNDMPSPLMILGSSTPDVAKIRARCKADIEARKAQYQAEIDALKFQVGTANQDELHEIINKRFAYEMAIELVENDVTENYRILYGTDVFPDGSEPVEPVGVVRT